MTTPAVVENAMLARIQAAGEAGVLGYAYPQGSLMSWPENFDQLLERETIRWPACWAVFGGVHSAEQLGRGSWKLNCGFGVVVGAQNARNEVSRRHGDPANPALPGSYQLAFDVFGLLSGQSLGLDISPLQPQSMQGVAIDNTKMAPNVSLFALSFATSIPFDAGQPSGLADFTTFHADWDLPPFGHVQPPLPDDGDAAAVDTVILQGAS